jgi:hypothetical protein
MQLTTITEAHQLPQTTDPQCFLKALGGPTLIRLQGRNPQRQRAFCTLLHGNEPSGLQALIAYLNSNQTPAVNIDIIIAAVSTALTPPLFSHRMLPGNRDLNRCFRPPFAGDEGKLAGAILDVFQAARPECLIDMHNTSGSGPAFGVAVADDADHRALTSLWTNDLIVTDLRLGALMELSEASVPTVTIECGGAADRTSLMIAQEGLQRYFQNEDVLATADNSYGVTCFRNPLRMELQAGCTVAYLDFNSSQSTATACADITMPANADRLNYGTVPAGEAIAWVGPQGLSALTAKDKFGQEQLLQHFEINQHQLMAKHPLKLFMATTNATIAQKDCLFYFIDCASS